MESTYKRLLLVTMIVKTVFLGEFLREDSKLNPFLRSYGHRYFLYMKKRKRKAFGYHINICRILILPTL